MKQHNSINHTYISFMKQGEKKYLFTNKITNQWYYVVDSEIGATKVFDNAPEWRVANEPSR